MRSTKLYIIISVVVLIIVGIIATILSNQLKKGSDTANNKQSAEKIESSGTRTLSRTEKYKEAGRITKQSNASLLSNSQVKNFDVLCKKVQAGQNGTLSNEDFDISCSTVTNQIYIQKKTDKADTQLEVFLKENNALDILKTDLSLFVKTDQPLAKYIKDQENYLIEELEIDETFPDLEITGTASNRSTDFDEIKNTFSEIIQSLYDIEKLATLEGTTDLSNTDTSVPGIQSTPNLRVTNAQGYYMMPTAPNGEYLFGGWNTCDTHKYGSKTLIDVINTVARRWHQAHPGSKLIIGDLNGPKVPTRNGHSSHGNGVDVDIMATGTPLVTNIAGSSEGNIELGKMFIDTGVVKMIIFGTSPTDQRGITVRNAWTIYANTKGLAFQPVVLSPHDTHFHVRINDQYRLAEYRPAPCN